MGLLASQVALVVKNPPANAGDIEAWGQSLGREDPLEEGMEPTLVFLPGESVDRGAWRATVHGVTKSQTRLKQFSMHTGTGDHVHRDVFFDLPTYLKKN